MGTDIPANIVYSDSQMVIITIESIPNSAPWLGQTTYLIDPMGRTTAILAQTDQPTFGVTLAPVPYTTQAQVQTPLPTKTASSLPSGWAYEGCYNDSIYARVLSLKQPYNTDLTVQACVWSCYEHGYSISGLEDRRQCFCGNAILNGGTLADWDFDCNTTCSGNEKEICGGSEKLSIYSNQTLTTSQSVSAQSSERTDVAPSMAPSSTVAISRTPIPAGTISGAGIAAVMGITLVVALIFYLRRRIKRNHGRNSRMQTSHRNTQAWHLANRAPSWEAFTKESEANSHGLGLRSANFSSYHSLPELNGRHEQLRRQQQPSPHVDFRSADTHLASTARYPGHQRASSREPLDPPPSILKNATPTKATKMARGTLEGADDQDPDPVPSATNLGLATKCVRFGRNQIREFGRSPFLGYGSNASET